MVLKREDLAENEMDCVKRENENELKMFKIDKTNDEGNSRSLVFKISRTGRSNSDEKFMSPQSDGSQTDIEDMLQSSVTLTASRFLSDDSKLLSFDSSQDIIPENHEPDVPSPSRCVKPCVVSVKPDKSPELRRSSRLQALHAKVKILDIIKEEKKDSDDSDFEDAAKLSKSEPRDKKPRMNSARRSVPSGRKRIRPSSEKSITRRDPKRMKLKTMLVKTQKLQTSIPTSSPLTKRNVFPKFANVDPSCVLSTLEQCKRILPPERKVIPLFFTGNTHAAQPSFRENRNSRYKFKKMQRDLSHLKKKYQMLDATTLDCCYAASGYSRRKTEIMLLDMISGKEINHPKDVSTSTYALISLNSPGEFHVEYFYPYMSFMDYNESEPQRRKNDLTLDDPQAKSSVLCHEVFAQAMAVLYNDESVTI